MVHLFTWLTRDYTFERSLWFTGNESHRKVEISREKRKKKVSFSMIICAEHIHFE